MLEGFWGENMRQIIAKHHIRLARPHECALLPAIEIAAGRLFLATKYTAIDGIEPLPLPFFAQQQRHEHLWVAADEEDIPVGFAIALIIDNRAHLHELSVRPEHGRQGLGTRLVQHVLDWAQKAGLPAVTLSTFRDVPWNAPFYRKLGFVELPETEYGTGLQEIRQAEASLGLPMQDRVLMVFRFDQAG